MNYETRAIGNEEVLGLPSPDAPRRGRTGLIIGIITVIAIVAAIARKQTASGVVLGEDVLTLMVGPEVDHLLVLGLVAVFGLINRCL